MITIARRTLPALAPVAPEVVSPRTAAHLREVVRFLALHQPTLRMTNGARSRTAAHVARTAQALAPLIRLLPFPADDVTRGEYALQVNEIARLHGTAWDGDEDQDGNSPAIPSVPGFPGPRTSPEPYPAGPAPIPGARPSQAMPAPCEPCYGQGGETVISNAGRGRIRKTFVRCEVCKGKGAV
ncbi:hypothetical protein ACFY0G_02095 [Streptomyces sp. NPDC001552]|uniref:hypothetical protein n=1 Tax=Streptomyces sp. NPDC001552 TaxID=3364587 RepID=UPI003682560A